MYIFIVAAAIIPFYNSYIQYKITWGNGWVFLVELVLAFLCSVPIICYLSIIATLVLHGFNSYKKSLAFGHSIPFAVGLFLFRWIFDLILAFGNSEYLGVPQEGFSFEQLNEKYGRKTNVTFAKPEQPQKPDIRYVKPDNKTDKEQDIVDSDIEYVDVDKE